MAFWFLAHPGLEDAAVASALSAAGLVVIWRGIFRRSATLFEVLTLVFFIIQAVMRFGFRNPLLTNNPAIANNAALTIVFWLSLLIKRPFTLDYVQHSENSDQQNDQKVLHTRISLVWAVTLLANLFIAIIARYTPDHYTMVLNIIVANLLICAAFAFTAMYPAAFREEKAKSAAN